MMRPWIKTTLVLLLGFTLGFIASQAARYCGFSCPGKPGHFQERLLAHWTRKLDLTPEQREQVAAILAAKREKMQALRGEFRPRFEEIRASAQQEIRAVLTPQQQVVFDRMQERWRQKRAKYKENTS